MIPKFTCWLGGILTVVFLTSNSYSQTPFQVTRETTEVSRYAWSPDGTKFAYTALCDNIVKLYRIDFSGENKKLLISDVNLKTDGTIDWKGSVITFKGTDATQPPSDYNMLLKRVNPDGSNERTIYGPYWYAESILRPDGGWLLFRDGPNGWWIAKRCDLNGGNVLTVSHSDLVQRIGWLGKSYILYARGADYYTPCKLYKVSFNGGPVQELTPNTIPKYADFSGSPDASKILYCDGTDANWDIWIMNADGSNKKQLTDHAQTDGLSWPLQQVWSLDSKSFYFVSMRTGKGDIYKMNIDGTGLIQITSGDFIDYMPNVSPDGKKLAFLSNRDGYFNIWVIDFEKIHVSVPDTTENADKIVEIPIRVTDVTNRAIYSFGMTTVTDPKILIPQGTRTTGTLSAPWGDATVNIQGGTMKIGIAGSTALAGSGKLIYLRYKVPPDVAHNAKTLITISDFTFNDGQPEVVIHNGSFTVIRKYDVAGDIKYCSTKIPIPNVSVTLDGVWMTTGNSGDFKFVDIIYGNYTLRPQKTGSSVHAVGPYDAALILLYSVQSITLTPYQMIAGDVSGNKSVTPYDASFVLQYYVGLVSKFPIGKDWKFVPVSFPINDTNWPTAPDTIRYEPLRADTINQNFVGIAYGDVSGNWTVPPLAQWITGSIASPKLVIGQLQAEKEGRYTLPLSLTDVTNLISLGLTCQYSPNQLQFLSAELVTTASAQPLFAYHDQNGAIKLGLASAVPLDEKSTQIKLIFKPTESIQKIQPGSFSIREFSINGQLFQIQAQSITTHIETNQPEQYELSQNYPNPFNAETLIKYQLPEAGYATITIYNLLGQKIRTLLSQHKEAGFHQIVWDGRDDGNEVVGSGEYICQMRVGEFVAIRKVVLIR